MGYGQFGMGHGMMWNDYCFLPDMTDEQAEQIKELRLAHYKEVRPLRDQMSELAIKHRNLMRAGNVDTKAINASIDEKTNVTDEQKMVLDNSGRGFGMRKGMRNFGRRGRSFRGGGFNKW
jgi:Spy/CpxP family protein refolding chaperone